MCVYNNIHNTYFIYVYVMEYYVVMKKKMLKFETTQIGLEGTTLSEICQIGKDRYYMISLWCET